MESLEDWEDVGQMERTSLLEIEVVKVGAKEFWSGNSEEKDLIGRESAGLGTPKICVLVPSLSL